MDLSVPAEGVPSPYEQAVSGVPVPSWDQTERFARYISTHHSWYKIALDAEHRIYPFLDPTAGYASEYQDGRERRVEVTKGWPGGILSTTQVWRQIFGFWNYYHSPVAKPVEVWLSEGSKVVLSEEWANAGLILLNPFAHGEVTPLDYLGGWGRFTNDKWPAKSIFDRIGMCLQERLSRRPRRLKEIYEAEIPAPFRTALIPSELPGRDSATAIWPDPAWKQQLLDQRVPENYWSPLCKYSALLATERQIVLKHVNQSFSSDYPIDFLSMALAEERVLMLTSMTDAMTSILRRIDRLR